MAVAYRHIRILTVGVVVFFRSPGIFHSQDSFPSTFRPRLRETSSGVVAVGVSGFQHTDRPRLSSLEFFIKDHNAGRETLSHLTICTFS